MPTSSVVWLLADKLNTQDACCKICNKVIKYCGTPTNIRRHLSKKHPSALARIDKTTSPDESDSESDNVDDIRISNDEIVLEESQPNSSLAKSIPTAKIPKRKRKSKGSLLEFFTRNRNSHSQPKCDYHRQTTSNPSLSNDGDEIQSTSSCTSLQLRNSDSSSSSQVYSVTALESSPSPAVASLQKDQSLKTCFDKLLSYKRGGDMERKITGSLIYLIIQNCLPFSIVETEAFKQFLHITCPHYQVPCATTITNMIDKKFEALFEIEKRKLTNIKNFALTIDAWTESHTLASILGITGHYIDNDGVLSSVVLGSTEMTERHTSAVISSYIKKVLDNWSIKKEMITAITTDNGANIVAAVKVLLDEDLHIGCFAHTLNLVLTAVFNDAKVEPIAEIINSVKKIVTWFHSSSIAAYERKKIEELCLIQSCVTRWNSTFYMIHRFLQLKTSVSDILLAYENAPNMVGGDSIAIMEDILPILDLFDKMTKDCSQEKAVSASRIIPICDFMESRLNEMKMKTNAGKNFLSIVKDAFWKRFKDIESNYILSICTILDPRYKKIHFTDAVKCSKAVLKIKSIVEMSKLDKNNYRSSVTNDDGKIEKPLLSELDSFTSKKSHSVSVLKPDEIGTYLRSPTIDISVDPLQYWYTNRNEYPQLYDIARKFLCVQGSSTPCERLFSLAGFIMNARRNRITMQRLES